jgi:hypothetical protein
VHNNAGAQTGTETWYDDTNGEIGDVCAWQNKKLGAYEVQLLWSNRAKACV